MSLADPAAPDLHAIPIRKVPFLPQRLEVDRREDGTTLLSNGHPLKPYPETMLAPLMHWAAAAPDRVWLAERGPGDLEAGRWTTLTYGAALAKIKRLAGSLEALGAGPDAPVMILSANSIDNALVHFAALWAGAPVVPVTPAYALLSQDFGRLNHIDRLTEPHLVYVEDGVRYARGLSGMALRGRTVIHSGSAPPHGPAEALDNLVEQGSRIPVRPGPGSVAKLMMTSGSTGEPKAVVNTHRNVAANAKMIRSVWDEAELEALCGGPQVMLNFLPWSHTYGAHAILYNMTDWGGTLYIDGGAPTPARLPEMLANLRSVSPTQHTTVPAAWAAIATALERDEGLAKTFFDRLVQMAYGGASLGQDIYDRIQAVAVRLTGERVSLSAGYGATETSPTASNVHWPSGRMGLIGLPLPGNTFKLVPHGDKTELRVKGVNVTPGYHRNAAKTAEAFDEEGFYRLGDAVRFADPEDPEAGLAFDGRLAEEFKLANGSWVSAGTLRAKLVAACDGLLSDAVICGLNESCVRALGFLDEERCRDRGSEADVAAALKAGLAAYNTAHPNASARIDRLLLLKLPPRPDLGEVTEKGYLNQNRIQSERQGDVEALYGRGEPSAGARLIVPDA